MRFQDYLKETLGTPKENTIGELRFCCPFCGENKYKFYVKDSLDSTNGQYICFKCGVKGNPITFMKDYYHVDSKGAFDIIEGKRIDFTKSDIISYSDELSETEQLLLMMKGVKVPRVSSKKKPPKLPTNTKLIKDNWSNQEAQPFINYLYSRGITKQQIEFYSIGYLTMGYCFKSDGESKMKLTNSVIFFTFDNEGNYIYWNTRSIEKEPYIKSINAPATENQFGKRDVIFNLNIAKHQPFIVINEGSFDALTFHKYGIATFGKHISDNQVKLITDNIHKDTPIFIYLDSDAIHENASLAERLYKTHKNTFLVPHGEQDANDTGFKKAMETIKNNKIKANGEGVQRYKLIQKMNQTA
nr:MAG TPA: DNA directed DNA polymerase [Herelleviridae sp.]